MKINGENLFFSGVISFCAIIFGIVIGWFIESLIENPINLVYVGLWIIFTFFLYFAHGRHLKRKMEAEE